MSRVLSSTRPRLFAAVAAVTGVVAVTAVSLATGAVGTTARPRTVSLSQLAHPAGTPADGAVNLPSTQLVSLAAARRTVTCTAKNTKVTVTKVARPYNHLLLKATNTSKDNCNAFSAPLLRMGKQAQSATWIIQETMPQTVVTLFPGESAYAGIIVSGIDQREDGYTARTLGVFFDGGKGDGSVGPEAQLKLSGKGVINADDAMVTYWQSSKKDALSW